MRWAVPILLVALFLIGCSQEKVTCNSPYISTGERCCLDTEGNGICDADETNGTCPKCSFDCNSCPPNIVTQKEAVTVKQYVCPDQTVVDAPERCIRAPVEPEYAPVLTNEDGQELLEEFRARPACRSAKQAVETYAKLTKLPRALTLEMKSDPKDEFKEVLRFEGTKVVEYQYGVFCPNTCVTTADYFLEPGKKYLVRARFEYPAAQEGDPVTIIYSNEHIVDHTTDGEYATRLC